MTALAAMMTEEGVLLGADSMRRKTDGTVSWDALKIFRLERDDIALAFGCAGATGNDFWNLADVTSGVFARIPREATDRGFARYVDGIVTAVCHSISKEWWLALHSVEGYESYVVFGGFVRGESGVAVYRLGMLGAELKIHCDSSLMGFIPVSGSDLVRQALDAEIHNHEYKTLSSGATLLEKYIRACIDGSGKISDCNNFGGTPHIAQVTASGFDWIVPLKPASVARPRPTRGL